MCKAILLELLNFDSSSSFFLEYLIMFYVLKKNYEAAVSKS